MGEEERELVEPRRPRRYTGIALAVMVVVVIAGMVWSDYQQSKSRLAVERAMLQPTSDPVARIPQLTQELLQKTLGISWKLPGAQQRGAITVAAVRQGSPAAGAGFRREDGIISCQGEPVQGPLPLLQILSQQVEGEEVEFQVVRDNMLHTVVVKGLPKVELPEGMPTVPTGAGPRPPRFIPISGLDMTVEFITEKKPVKMVISEVKPGGAAEKSGLEPGDEIRTCDGSRAEAPLDLMTAVGGKKPEESLELGVVRGGKDLTIRVENVGLPPAPSAADTPSPAPG